MQKTLTNMVSSILTLTEVPDERVIALIPFAQQDANQLLSKDLSARLADAQDEAYMMAVAHFIAARLVLSSRPLVMGQGFEDSAGAGQSWGEGTERKAAINDLLTMAAHHKDAAAMICHDILKSQTEDPSGGPRWYVL